MNRMSCSLQGCACLACTWHTEMHCEIRKGEHTVKTTGCPAKCCSRSFLAGPSPTKHSLVPSGICCRISLSTFKFFSACPQPSTSEHQGRHGVTSPAVYQAAAIYSLALLSQSEVWCQTQNHACMCAAVIPHSAQSSSTCHNQPALIMVARA